MHVIIIWSYDTRLTWSAMLKFINQCKFKTSPDVEALIDLKCALKYRDKPGKQEAWNAKYPSEERGFFRLDPNNLEQLGHKRGSRTDILDAV